MIKFKKGELAIVISHEAGYFKKGAIVEILEEDDCPYVKLIRGELTPLGRRREKLSVGQRYLAPYTEEKIAIYCADAAQYNALMRYLEQEGYRWECYSPTSSVHNHAHPCINISKKVLYRADADFYIKNGYTIIPFTKYALDNNIPLKEPKKPVEVILNDEYKAVVSESGVKVGCQEFEFERIEALWEVVKEFK